MTGHIALADAQTHTHTHTHTKKKYHHAVGALHMEVRGEGSYSHGTLTDWRNGLSTDLLKFHKDSCEVMHMQGIKNMHWYGIGTERRASSFAEKT